MTRDPQVQPRHQKPMRRSETKANKSTTCHHGHDLKTHGVWRERGSSMAWRCTVCEKETAARRNAKRAAARRELHAGES